MGHLPAEFASELTAGGKYSYPKLVSAPTTIAPTTATDSDRA
jgi:hypothetical protein